MKNLKSLIMKITGTMLLLAALFLVIYNINEDQEGNEAARNILEQLREDMTPPATIPESTELPDPNDLFGEYETTEPETKAQEGQIEIDGKYYIGTIRLPTLEIELPVASEWSYPNLRYSPCRYKGTVADGDMIIAAHNYSSHFGKINHLYSGDTVIFTDAYGVDHEYMVIQTEMIEGRNIEAMEFGSAKDWDLTLFTCTLGGQSRVTVRAVAIEPEDTTDPETAALNND